MVQSKLQPLKYPLSQDPLKFASTLTACGLDYKPVLKNVVDIDAQDIDNELAAVEYVEDIYKFHKVVENDSMVHDYMPCQREINDKMRAILIDWLIEVHNKFELSNEALYLTINRLLEENCSVLA